MTNHWARQLDLPLVLCGDLPERLAPETEPLQRLRAYLGWQPFDDAARTRVTHGLTPRATAAILPRDRVERAAHRLRLWPSVLPARATLAPLVVSVTAPGQAALDTRLAAPCPPALQQALDDLLDGPAGARRSMRLQRKASPPEASPAVRLRSIERYQFLHDLGVSSLDRPGLSPALLRYWADRATRTDARACRRLAPATRSTRTACVLGESSKTMLDPLVALPAQLLTKKRREAPQAFAQRYQQRRRQDRRGLPKLIAPGHTLLEPPRSATTTRATVLEDLDATAWRAAVDIGTKRQQLEERGASDALRARAPGLRRSLPAFCARPCQGEPGRAALLQGRALVR